MKSPIEVYKEICKEAGLTEEINVSPVGKMTYIQEQVGQQKAILNRLLFDATTAKVHMGLAKDPASINAHRKKYEDYIADIGQIKGGLEVNMKLIDELRVEYPVLQPEK